MRRALSTFFRRLPAAAALLAVALAALPASATVPFSYRWKSPRVTVVWQEGNETPDVPGARRQVAHWKRLAESLWAQKPGAAPLEMRVNLYGQTLGGPDPAGIRLKSGSRTAGVEEPLTDAALARALVQLRDGAPPAALPALPPDDAEPRIAPDGKWMAAITWRGGSPEVWAVQRHGNSALRVPFPGGDRVQDRLVQHPPVWSADGRMVAWVQGGRVALMDVIARTVRLVTPKDRQAVECSWAPAPFTPLAVRYEDESFDLVDPLRGKLVPVSDLLRGAAPASALFWSGTGRRILFRTQTRLTRADLSGPLGALSQGSDLVRRAAGGADAPKAESGQAEERIAVLDLGARRLETYPADALPPGVPIRAVSWAPEEDRVYLVLGRDTGARSLFRFPLQQDYAPTQVLVGIEGLEAVGRRGDTEFAFLKRAAGRYEVFTVLDSERPRITSPYEAAEMEALALQPGPEGGYLGVEADTLTEDERGALVVLETRAHTGGLSTRERFPGGLLLTLDTAAPLAARLREQLATSVDLDFYPHLAEPWAVLMAAPAGAAGTLTMIDADAMKPGEIFQTPLTERLGRIRPAEIAPDAQPLPVTDAQSGLGALSTRYAQSRVIQTLIGITTVATVLLVLFLLRPRRRPAA